MEDSTAQGEIVRGDGEQPRVLVVCYYFPPTPGAQPSQALKAAIGLRDLGWDVHVVSVDARYPGVGYDAELEAMLDGSRLPVTRTRMWVPGRVLQAGLKRVAPWALDSPDKHVMWPRLGFRQAKALAEKTRPDVIYSRAQSFVSHLLSLRLSASLGVPFVAHFSDPWVDNEYVPRGRYSRARNLRMERSVIEAASATTFIDGELRDFVLGKYSSAIQACGFVVPHHYDEAQLAFGAQPASGAAVEIVHLGATYGQRHPSDLFAGLARLRERRPDLAERLRVRFVGLSDKRVAESAAAHGVSAQVTVEEPVGYSASLQMMANADWLLLLDPSRVAHPVNCPSKMTDYLAAGRPILVVSVPESPVSKLAREFECPVVAPDDADEMASVLERIAGGWNPVRYDTERARAALAARSLAVTSRQVDAILRTAFAEGRPS
jgi:hypothetical protein